MAIDGLDLLLALAPPEAGVSPLTLSSFLLNLRSSLPGRHSTVLTISADAPLLHNASAGDATPLELSHRQFLTITAHQADWVVQLRGLDTGAARDVSGVLRISNGGGGGGGGPAGDGEINQGRGGRGKGKEAEEEVVQRREDGKAGREWLYQVKSDGSVRVWTRGE